MRYYVYILFTLSIFSCREDLEFDGDFEPRVNIRFFDADSTANTALLLQTFEDSLVSVNERIANGEMLEETATLLQDTITKLQPILENLQSGLISIDSVMVTGVDAAIFVGVSDTLFSFPLDPNLETTAFSITFLATTNQLDLDYEKIVTDGGEEIHFQLSEVRVGFTTYTSAIVSCEVPCTSNETTINLYY